MRRFKEEQKYKVVKAKLPTQNNKFIDRWFITEDYLPNFEINQWLDNKSIRKISTGKEYANKLVVFLNYLDNRKKSYELAKKNDIDNFFKFLIYGEGLEVTVIDEEGQLSYSTLSKYITVIKEFYKWYDSLYGNGKYLSLWNYDFDSIIKKYVLKLKGKKEYIKWYNEEEKDYLSSNLLTLRDKAIFLISLEGFRIDEVLSIKLKNYDSFNRLIKPSRSKGRPNATDNINILRTVALPLETCEVIDRYLNTERADAEYESSKLSEMMFINLRKGDNQGEPVSYRNFWEILKRTAMRANINPEKIRTHSGRSTKVMEMIEHQVEYPEDGVTDTFIKEHFGWKNLDSIKPYRDDNNPVIAKKIAERIHGRKFNKHASKNDKKE